MRLPHDAVISPEKFTKYLLVKRPVGDKSEFLKQAGYTLDNWQRLEQDIRQQILSKDALPLGTISRQGRKSMKFKLFQQVALAKDIPEKKLQRGDLATVEDYHRSGEGEPGYSIEVFNAVGDTIAVTAVPESFLQELRANEILHVRPLAESA